MKNILVILFSFFMFVACTTKQIVEAPKIPKVKKDISKKNIPSSLESKNIFVEDDGLNKIAVIYPSRVVAKYIKSTLNTINAFLIYNNKPFVIEVFNTLDESPVSILREVNNLNNKGFKKVMALFTQNGFNILKSLNESKLAKYYFPFIHKSEIYTQNENFIFGGISYSNQLDLLQTISNGRNTMFYVKSYRGNKLRDVYINSFNNTGIIKEIKRKNNRYTKIVNDKRMRGTTVVLNTPIVKSSIIMTQLTAFDIYPSKVVSTQLNYNPLLMKLTQARDRKNFFVVNSIAEVDPFIEEYINLLGSDVRYKWVDYSTLVGINYLLHENESESIKIQVIDNQVNYKPILYKGTSYGFEKVLMY